MKLGLLIPLNLLAALALGISLVWMATERIQIGYQQRALMLKKQELMTLVDKLKTERGNLTSPYNLRRLADSHGLQPARPGQLRHLESARSVKEPR